jgi:hypothetical protein
MKDADLRNMVVGNPRRLLGNSNVVGVRHDKMPDPALQVEKVRAQAVTVGALR